ncbi:hypothetical protein IMSHALPRED_006013 [Imshaugia aleurites]|uniref:Sin3-associated polypeptide Sap18 n=1 Tax=Imshaugia aleurites TaxID=172621 RepID=A0A8H3IK19_9LECA|nr:hypothetical protein IMSHALPRED_006013 [Imshaugia aleurites]
MAMQTGPGGKVDRQTTTPFHLKLFYRTGSFHSLSDFPLATPNASSHLPPHLQIYTWPTCTLRELSHLLVTALPSLLPSPAIGTRLSYRLVYPDTHSAYPGAGAGAGAAPGRYLSKELGEVVVGDWGGGGGGDENNKNNGNSGNNNKTSNAANSGSGNGSVAEPSADAIVRDGVMAGALSGTPDKTLQEARFVIGDFISCAVMLPGPDGSVAPVRAAARGRGEFAGRGGGGGGYGFQGENGIGGFRGRGRGGFGGGFGGAGRGGGGGGGGDGGVPVGEWRRGERVPEGGRGGYGGGRGRGRGY